MPRISILISLFRSEEFLPHFLKNLRSQTCFEETEPVFIDANEDDRDFRVIEEFLKSNKNCLYFKAPGCNVYQAWNKGIEKSNGDIVTNWNTDDRRFSDSLEMQLGFLDQNQQIDLCYGEVFVTETKNEDPEKSSSGSIFPCVDFSKENMLLVNSPHCMPVWRKKLHDKFGMFDDSFFSAGDYEMWMRSIDGGAIFKKIYFPVGSYYRNPVGVSSGEKTIDAAIREVKKIKEKFSKIFSIRSKLLENYSSLSSDEREFYLENRAMFFENSKDSFFFEGCMTQDGQLFSKEREAIYDFVLEFKPEVCLEIGTCLGTGSTFFILSALNKNNHGELITCECVDSFIDKAKLAYSSTPEMLKLGERCKFKKTCSTQDIERVIEDEGIKLIDFLVLDGAEDASQTLEQINLLKKYLREGAGVFCHDWNTKKMELAKSEFLKEDIWAEFVSLNLPESIGCKIFRKK